MLLPIDIIRLNITCEEVGITKPITLTDAEALHLAAVALLAEISAEVEPNHYSITVKNLNVVHAAIVAWPSHVARESAAIRLLQVAEGKVTEEWMRFTTTLYESLRGPFDNAAAAYTAGDEKALPVLIALAPMRDIIAQSHVRPTLRADALDQPTRILDVVSVRHALYLVTNATRGMDRFGADWFKAVRDLNGVTIRWMTPADQVAQDKALPYEARDLEGSKV